MAVRNVASPLHPIAGRLVEPGPKINRPASAGSEGLTHKMKTMGEATRNPYSPSGERASPSLSSRSIVPLRIGPRVQQLFQRRPETTSPQRTGLVPSNAVSPLPSLMLGESDFANLETITTQAFEAIQRDPIKAEFGDEGPTFVLNTPDCVLKLTTPQEMAFQILYREFGFQAPQSQAIDFIRAIQFNESTSRDRKIDHVVAVRRNFFNLARACRAKVNPNKPVLMYSERIRGQNLFDFARFTYMKLSDDQKTEFFRQLGRIAMLDFVSGQFDRLFEVDYYDGNYTIDDLGAANLGNVLVTCDGGSPRLYPIDNGLDPDLMSNLEERQERAAAFIEAFSKKEASLESLATCIADHLLNAIDRNCDEDQWTKPKEGELPNRNVIFKEFARFCSDLKRIAIPAMIEGLREKREDIRKTYVPTFQRIGKHLDFICPGLCKQVMRRFAFLNQFT